MAGDRDCTLHRTHRTAVASPAKKPYPPVKQSLKRPARPQDWDCSTFQMVPRDPYRELAAMIEAQRCRRLHPEKEPVTACKKRAFFGTFAETEANECRATLPNKDEYQVSCVMIQAPGIDHHTRVCSLFKPKTAGLK